MSGGTGKTRPLPGTQEQEIVPASSTESSTEVEEQTNSEEEDSSGD